MTFSAEDVRTVADLARLMFSEGELRSIAHHLNDIVEYVNQLQQVETTGIEPMFHALDLVNNLRDDIPGTSLTVAEALANAPDRKDNYFSVPAVFDE